MKKAPGRKNIEDILALTPMQQGMLFHYLRHPQSRLYFEQLSLEISGITGIELFKQAWSRVIAANEILRTEIRWEKMENSLQVILKKHPFQPAIYDLTRGNSDETRNDGVR